MPDTTARTPLEEILSLGRVLRFGAVGAAGAALDTGLLIASHGVLDVPLLASKLLSAESAIVVMFLLNEYWTFDAWTSGTLRARLRRLATSNVVRLGGLVTGLAVLLFLTDVAEIWYPLANGVGLCAGFVVNYACESLFTWQIHAD